MSKLTASILTPSHRKFVAGQSEPSNPRVYKERIRNRIEAGLFDMAILSANYDSSQIRQSFNAPAQPISKFDETQDKISTGGQGATGVPGTIAFLIEGLNRGEPIDPIVEEKDGVEQPALIEFRKAVEKGVQNYLAKNTRYLADVNVSIELDDIDHIDDFSNASQPDGE